MRRHVLFVLTVALVMTCHVQGGVNRTGVIMHTVATASSFTSARTHTQRAGVAPATLCVSGRCPHMTNVSGCAPLPLVPCDPNDPAQQWSSIVTGDGKLAPATMRMVNKGNGGCLSGWSKHAVPGVSVAVPLTGVAECATGWGTSIFDWNPYVVKGLLINSGAGASATGSCLSASHPALSTVLAYEYKQHANASTFAAFVQNSGPSMQVDYHGLSMPMDGGSTSLVMVEAGKTRVLFNTNAVSAAGIKCNRSYIPMVAGAGVLSDFEHWEEPLPPVGGSSVQSSTPLEQLNLTQDKTEYMFYTAVLPGTTSSSNEDTHISGHNLTIQTIESNAFVLFLDGEYVGEVNDHTKGPDHLTLSVSVPPSTADREMVLLSGSMGIQNFHGALLRECCGVHSFLSRLQAHCLCCSFRIIVHRESSPRLLVG